MKKVLALVMAAAMILSLAACGKDAPSYEGSMSDLIDAIYAGYTVDAMLMDNMSVDVNDADLLRYYAAVTDKSDVSEVYYSEAAINIDPYILAAIRVAEGKDAKAVAASIFENADTGRWVCVRPESCRVGQYGDVIVMVMGTKEVTEGIMNAFAAAVGADLETSHQK